MSGDNHPDEEDGDDRATTIESLETKLDLLVLLVGALLVLQIASLGGDLLANLAFITIGLGVLGFVAVLLIALGKHL